MAIVGPNGVGKTNLLLAIYYVAYAKLYKSGLADALNIKSGEKEMSIITDFIIGERTQKAAVEVTAAGKKLYIDDQHIRKVTEYIKDHHVVLVTPDDIQIINGGSEQRRGYLDMLLSKVDTEYLEQLLKYKKYHRTRNAYLKMRKGLGVDPEYLQAVDEEYARYMQTVYMRRDQIFGQLQTLINHLYGAIAQRDDQIRLEYQSPLSSRSAAEMLRSLRSSDIAAGRTTEGVHRDDIYITINGQSAKDFASQGQKKSILFAMRLAEMQLIQQMKGHQPIVMIDDLFEKLDDQRIRNLMKVVEENQLILTDTSSERIRKLLGDEAQVISLT